MLTELPIYSSFILITPTCVNESVLFWCGTHSLFPAELLTASFNGLFPSTANYFHFMDCQSFCYCLYGWWASEQMPMYHQSNSDNYVCHLFPTQKRDIFQFPLGMSPLLVRILICHPHLHLLSRRHDPGEGSSELIKMLIQSSGSPSIITLLL